MPKKKTQTAIFFLQHLLLFLLQHVKTDRKKTLRICSTVKTRTEPVSTFGTSTVKGTSFVPSKDSRPSKSPSHQRWLLRRYMHPHLISIPALSDRFSLFTIQPVNSTHTHSVRFSFFEATDNSTSGGEIVELDFGYGLVPRVS